MSWEEQAACRDVDEATKRCFPSWEMNKQHANAALIAISVCRTCPVAEACLADARARKDFGVRGGVMRLEPWSKTGREELTEDQVRALAAGASRSKPGAEEGAA